MRAFRTFALPALALIGCTANGGVADGNAAAQSEPQDTGAQPFRVQPVGQFSEPWAMAFLPGGRQALITEKHGALKLWTVGGAAIDVSGVPQVDHGGQGGLGDVILHPEFATNNIIYLSWAEAGEGDTRGAAVGRGRLVVDGNAARLEGLQVIWRQQPKVTGRGHYAHRLLFSPDGRHLFISSGDRQKFDPAQDMNANLGKILRLNPDGSVPADNPFADRGGVAAQIWVLGLRNPLGFAFAPDGRFWEIEMGPEGGDELNLVQRGANYGYPIVSDGDHYDGRPIPDHSTRPEFAAPKVTWTPVISPGNMIVYTGDLFPQWRGDALVPGLSSEALIHVDLDGDAAREAGRWPMGARIREVEQAPDGSLYLLEDSREGRGGRLLHLTPAG
ncbi:PQQ-dependent sugar dehydrogenase [Sphingosinicella terrae]|uniref:PQQ-dependent sugar dehydrogenase n=1 Tax=Sphingosinicella terrae TaxID=2172047 RepID=UPI000E0DDEFD|nr:PQQ-dependent sugar dehydrogenase [Sphingosinicella terrae]